MRYSNNKKAAGANPAAVFYKRSKYSKNKNLLQGGFDKSDLQKPSDLLAEQSIKYRKHGDALSVYCPFHKGGMEKNPSLLMSDVTGHYRCLACGKKGGDLIQFYRDLTGCSFGEAVDFLGGAYAS